MSFLLYSLWIVLGTILVIGLWIIVDMLWHTVNAQTPQVPTIQYAPVQVQPAGQNDYLAMVMPLALTAGSAVLGMFIKNLNDKQKKTEEKTDKVVEVQKDNMGETLKNKELIREIARVMFEMNEEKSKALTDAPAIKLETLKDDTDEFRKKVAES